MRNIPDLIITSVAQAHEGHHTITAADANAGHVTNTATATGTNPQGVLTAGHDLSDPLQVDASEAAQITRAAQLAVLGRFTWIRETDEMTWSDEIWTMLGYEPAAAPPQSRKLFLSHLNPHDREAAMQTISAAWAEQRVLKGTYRSSRRDGVVIDVECHVEAMLDEHGQPCGVIGTGQDVTVRERARQEVERLKRRYDTVNAAIAD